RQGSQRAQRAGANEPPRAGASPAGRAAAVDLPIGDHVGAGHAVDALGEADSLEAKNRDDGKSGSRERRAPPSTQEHRLHGLYLNTELPWTCFPTVVGQILYVQNLVAARANLYLSSPPLEMKKRRSRSSRPRRSLIGFAARQRNRALSRPQVVGSAGTGS